MQNSRVDYDGMMGWKVEALQVIKVFFKNMTERMTVPERDNKGKLRDRGNEYNF